MAHSCLDPPTWRWARSIETHLFFRLLEFDQSAFRRRRWGPEPRFVSTPDAVADNSSGISRTAPPRGERVHDAAGQSQSGLKVVPSGHPIPRVPEFRACACSAAQGLPHVNHAVNPPDMNHLTGRRSPHRRRRSSAAERLASGAPSRKPSCSSRDRPSRHGNEMPSGAGCARSAFQADRSFCEVWNSVADDRREVERRARRPAPSRGRTPSWRFQCSSTGGDDDVGLRGASVAIETGRVSRMTFQSRRAARRSAPSLVLA